ncbi:hypothetical protein ACK3YV_07400 [Aeromonas caviae]
MSFLDKYGLKPHKLTIELDGEEHTFYAKHISYNLAVSLSTQYLEGARELAVIMYCLCEEDGTMVFDKKTELAEVGDKISYELITLMATKIAEVSGPQKRVDNIKKKQES